MLSLNEQRRIKAQYGTWALVTGASSGIGLAIAEELAAAGIHLVLNARNKEQLFLVKKELEQRHRAEVKIIAADISTADGIDTLIRETQQLSIGLLVASAGYGTSGLFIDASLHKEINMLRINCEAVLALTHHYSQQFVQRKRGGIILLSSIVAFQGVPYAAHYAATKAYIQTLAEGLAVELKPSGVDVLSAAPGPVESGFGKRANMQMYMSLQPQQIAAPILKALGRSNHVVPGALSKLLVYSLRTAPRWAKIKIMEKIMGRMTLHQRK
ncbi:SDR family NAD(P)-dependent oxidoreductase [Lacibacter sediminis]|uniref:SDR family NAD(P)-dependent oxidoreductase n=1 Tax=Lacibacter sediminis TaxID=2760713 RepID=A0A7G5XJF2_9BACT|nr:SDR family NAD(P)-dependent oxidoreductase [Lacibacter sediminis]QNA45605.1 SDR family NAD(P)-dependent oxidoreductase [Lacibacter sediminis]